MNKPGQEEQLRQTHYIHCRNQGYTIEDASKRSLAYIKRVLNADKSLTSTRYLEELYQHSLSRPTYFSSSSSYDDNVHTRSSSSRKSKDGGKHHVFDDFSDMMDSVPIDRERIDGNVRKPREKNKSVPSYRAPEYIYFPYDYQGSSRESRGGSYSYAPPYHSSYGTRSYSHSGPYGNESYAPPYQSSHDPRSYSHSGPYYNTEERQPSSAYRPFASGGSNYPSYPSSSPEYSFYASPHAYTAGSTHPSHAQTRPSYSYTRPPSPHHPVTPPPQGIKPTTDLYTVLGLSRGATAVEIRKAHRAMSLKWHPDRSTMQDKGKATDKMAEINQANDVLGNEVKRRFYDRCGTLPSDV